MVSYAQRVPDYASAAMPLLVIDTVTCGALLMNHSAGRENIKLLSTRLKSELHPTVRSRLQKLLIEEEDKLGADLQFLAEVEQAIISFEAVIETQKKLVATLQQSGSDVTRELTTLNGLRATHALCQMYRQKIIFASENKVL